MPTFLHLARSRRLRSARSPRRTWPSRPLPYAAPSPHAKSSSRASLLATPRSEIVGTDRPIIACDGPCGSDTVEDRTLISAASDFGTIPTSTRAAQPSVVYIRRIQGRRVEPLADLIVDNVGPNPVCRTGLVC